MKKIIEIGMLVLLSLSNGCSESNISQDSNTVLTQEEKDDLIFLREEEKLARDVYLFSYDKYGEEIFSNISQSEQRHMDKVLTLLEKYNLKDPVSSERGVFTNQTLQKLYNDLIALSGSSLIEALKVGATIEDLDIRDIGLNEDRTTISDIEDVYRKLKCASTNHMRGFNAKIIENGTTYAPQYITIDYFNTIINSTNQQCGKQ